MLIVKKALVIHLNKTTKLNGTSQMTLGVEYDSLYVVVPNRKPIVAETTKTVMIVIIFLLTIISRLRR